MKNQLITFMAGLSLAFTSCVDMDMVPKSQGNSESWYTTETELKMAVNEFYILGYWKMDSPESMEQYSDNFTYRNTNRKTLLDGTLNGQTYEVHYLKALNEREMPVCLKRLSTSTRVRPILPELVNMPI